MKHFPHLSAGFAALLEAIPSGARVAVIGHARPDGDCIGSQVALCRMLRSRGFDAECVNTDPVPRRLRFLVGDTPFRLGREFAPGSAPLEGWVAIYTDCADHARAGDRMVGAFPGPLGNIDHHLSNEGYATHNVVDAHAAATAEVLAGLFFDAGFAIDPLSAQALYAGIVTDTGQFRFPSTSRRVFEITGQLMDAGADPAGASAEIYERESFEKLELLGRFLESLKRECSGRVCIGFLPMKAFAETGALSEDTEGLVDYARAIDGVEIGVLIEERPQGVKASLRAKDPLMRVDRIAGSFGGGGHACAAGLSAPLGMDEIYKQLIAAIDARLREVDSARLSS